MIYEYVTCGDKIVASQDCKIHILYVNNEGIVSSDVKATCPICFGDAKFVSQDVRTPCVSCENNHGKVSNLAQASSNDPLGQEVSVVNNKETEVDDGEQNSYKSPVRKLVNFFEKSRDNWKEKYQRNKKENNKLKNKVCALKASQEKWKSETLLLRKQLKQAAINTENTISVPTKKNRI